MLSKAMQDEIKLATHGVVITDETFVNYYLPLIQHYIKDKENKKINTYLIGIQGCQGVGKTVLTTLIKIFLRSLGYKIELILDNFITVGNEYSRYRIYPKFVLMEAENEKEQKRWERNRLKTYRGSIKHFLSVLARGKLEKEHFTIYRGHDMKGLIRGFGEFITSNDLKVEPMESPLYKKFYLDTYLSVIYGDRYGSEPGIITFNQDYVIIDTLGNVVTQFILLKGGEWSNEGIADLLPTEFIPEEDRN